MKSFWYFIYLIVLIFICFLLPFALFFYETDEEDGFCRRFVKGFLYTLAANIISVLLLFISWNYFKFVELPVHTVSAEGIVSFADTGVNLDSIAQADGDMTLEL